MRALIAIGPAQSNCQGVGNSTLGTLGSGLGCPQKDPISPKGNYNTPWPFVAAYAGARGNWYQFRNHAVGSTNIADVWVGRARSYIAGMIVAPGSYVIDAGNIYKAVGTLGQVYTLNVSPSAGVGSSGLSSWTNLGAAAASDADGKIYAEGSPRFDPNGLIAAIYADINPMPGYDKKAVFISIGQTDKTLSTTRQQYSQSLNAAASYFTSRGIYVFIGMTCYDAESGAEAYYQSTLLPGRIDALSGLASNPMVFAGANWRDALGVLSVSPAFGPGLIDNYHMNSDAQALAARAWDNALIAAGW